MSELPFKPGQHPRIPGSFADELRMAYRAPAGVPESVDQAVLAAARDRAVMIGRARSRRLIVGRISAVAGLAAAIAIAAVVWPRIGGGTTTVIADGSHHLPRRAGEGGGTGIGADPRDVNADGVVDILDAFAIAKAVGGSPQEQKIRAAAKAWDVNGDGAVDRRDADSVAVSVVRLGPPAGRG